VFYEDALRAARRVVEVLDAEALPWVTERGLQDLAGDRLEMAGFEVDHEVQIPGGRIDLLVKVDGARVGVEVKTAGTLGDLVSQLHRYAQSGKVDAVVALVGKSRLAVDAHKIGTVPLMTCIGRGF